MKKITFVFPHLGRDGGADQVLSVLINFFAACQYKVQVILLTRNINEYELSSSIDIVFLDWERYKTIIQKLLRLKNLRRAIVSDTIITFFDWPIRDVVLATLGQNKKIIISERTDPRIEPAGRIRRLIRDVSYSMADICVFQTEDAKRFFFKRIQKKGVIIPNPVRKDIPEPFIGIRKKKIVAAGRLVSQKNFPLLIKAFAKLHSDFPDYSLYIYGQGKLEEILKDLIDKMNLKEYVFFPGFARNVNEYMNDAAIYVSSSDYEGISNSMIEALAMGVPTVCTDCPVGGARLMIENGENGLLVPVGDVDALYRAMKRIIEEPELAEKLSRNACKIREAYSEDRIMQKWLELLQ